MSLEHSGAPTERQIRPAAGLAGCSGRQPDERIQPRSPSSNRPAGLKLCVGDPAVLEALGPSQPAKSGRPNRLRGVTPGPTGARLLSLISRFDQAALVREDYCLHSITQPQLREHTRNVSLDCALSQE